MKNEIYKHRLAIDTACYRALKMLAAEKQMKVQEVGGDILADALLERTGKRARAAVNSTLKKMAK
jgi:hypothetical protein